MKAYIQCEKEPFIPTWLKGIIEEQVNNLESADLLILKGHRNVHPSFYRDQDEHPFLPKTYDKELDTKEIILLKKAIKLEIPILAIQRGAILAGIEAGCGVIQFCSGKNTIIEMVTKKGLIPFYSLMSETLDPSWIFPKNKYSLLGYIKSFKEQKCEKGNRKPYFSNESERESFRIPTVLYFKDISCLAISSDTTAFADVNKEYSQFLKDSLNQMLKITKSLEVHA